MTTSADAGVAISDTHSPSPEPDSVYIVGFAPTWKDTPWGNPQGHYWGMNALHKLAPDYNWNAWFQLHDIDEHHPLDKDEHLEWLRSRPDMPVFMWEEHIPKYELPNAVPYPRQHIVDKYGGYFTNTVSWMIAYAMEMEWVKKLAVYGVDMAQDCIAPETRVLTSDLQWVEAGKVEVGDTVLGFDEHSGVEGQSFREWKPSEVLEANRLIRPSYRIHLSDGTEVVASAGHQWLTYGEHQLRWKRTDQLLTATHRRPTRLVRYLDTWSEDRSWVGGYLAAAFDGEGHISQGTPARRNSLSVGFAQRQNAMLTEVDNGLAHLGFDMSRGSEDVVKGTIKGGKAEILRFLGTVRPLRLLDKFDPSLLGITQRKETPAVEHLEFLGDTEVIGFKTSTKTFLAEGLASHNSEYGHQRPSCEYFLGLAVGRGIEVEIPKTSDLLKSPFLYGIEDGGVMRLKYEARLKELQERLNETERQRNQAHEAVLQIAGAIEDTRYWLRAWSQEEVKNG